MHAKNKTCKDWFTLIIDLVVEEKLDIRLTSSEEQAVDVFTKRLGETKFNSNKTKLMVLLALRIWEGILDNGTQYALVCVRELIPVCE